MTIRKIVWFWIVVLCISMTLPMIIAAQAPAPGGQRGERGGGQRAPAAPPTNLQVLPKDWTRPQVVQVMQQFTMGLGVQCNYCHAEMVGAPPNANGQIPIDAASDDKPLKNTARVMMRMVGDINKTLGGQLGKPASDVVQVQCITCHRGAAIPKTQ
ncbi:MAG TPA: c-type cytochrome [Terriglobia bacterium]|nr:c-type cytochrome [Terriglobia bacterium]